jgi:hypothetical protein
MQQQNVRLIFGSMLMPHLARSRGTPVHLKITLPTLKKTDPFLLEAGKVLGRKQQRENG